jgi:hypothetical protein
VGVAVADRPHPARGRIGGPLHLHRPARRRRRCVCTGEVCHAELSTRRVVIADVRVALAITVIVDTVVPGVHRAGVHVRVVVITVGVIVDESVTGACLHRAVRVSIPIAVGVYPEALRIHCVLVNLSIAVIVEGVTDLTSKRIDEDVGVITVAALKNVAFWRVTALDRTLIDTEAVAIAVWVPGGRSSGALIHLSIAVVVQAIAELDRIRVHGVVLVVAVIDIIEAIAVGVADDTAGGADAAGVATRLSVIVARKREQGEKAEGRTTQDERDGRQGSSTREE